MWVSANDSGAITVTRALGGTTATTLATNNTFAIVGMARLEGDDSDPIGYTDLSTNSNYTQIFHKEVKQTGTAPIKTDGVWATRCSMSLLSQSLR